MAVKEAKFKRYNGTEWEEVKFPPAAHTHTKANITDFPTSLPASDVYSWAKASAKPSYNFSEIGSGFIKSAVIDTHPEGSTTTLAYYINDLCNLVARGGSCTAVNKTTGATISYSASWFDGTPSYGNFSVSSVTDVVEILVVSPTSYSWGTHFGIGFGNGNWRAKDVKIEVGYATDNGTVWVTRLDAKNSGNSIHDVSTSGPGTSNTATGNDGTTITGTSSNTWNRIRITLTNFQGTSPRIAQIWSQNYGSSGLAMNFLQKSGGSLWGNIIAGKNNTYNIGESGKQFNNIYAANIYQNGVKVLTSHQSLANYYTKTEVDTAISNAITNVLNTAV